MRIKRRHSAKTSKTPRVSDDCNFKPSLLSENLRLVSVKNFDESGLAMMSRRRNNSARSIRQTCLVLSICATGVQAQPGTCPPKQPLRQQSWTKASPQPLTDSSPPEAYTPWSHPPLCVDGTDAQRQAAEYCLYTADYLGPHGLSIIARPDVAAQAVGTLLATYDSSFPSPATVRNLATDGAYAVVDVPGRGKGVVARRRIRHLDTFMVDHASLLTDAYFPTAVDPVARSGLLRKAAGRLADPDGGVFGLARAGNTEENIVEDVMGTNSFLVTLTGVPHKALYPSISVSSPISQ